MDPNTDISLEFLKRIIALLLSLAGRAEAASNRSWRVRRRVLAILRRAEIAAYSSVAKAANGCGAAIPPGAIIAAGAWMSDAEGNGPEDAMALARRFRALALALAYLGTILEQSAYGTLANYLSVSPSPLPATHPRSNQLLAALRASIARAPP
jgi:hypothetical protein